MRLWPLLMVSLLVLAACAAPAKTRYYLLSGGSAPASESEAPAYRVAIGPVTVPEALDRQQIVLHVAPDRYVITDGELWAEPLKRDIPRVIADDVGQHLPAARVAAYFQLEGQGADYRVFIDVLRFESAPGQSSTLDVAWSVRNRAGERLHEAHSVFVEAVAAPGIEPLIAAHAKALDAFGREIAVALDRIARAR